MATDQELLFALRREDPQALEAVIRAYSPYVSAVIEYQLGRNAARGDVEELSADVFFTLWQWRGRLQTNRLRGWLGATARNAARDFLRKRQLHTVAAEDYLTISDESAQKLLEQAERTTMVQAALEALAAHTAHPLATPVGQRCSQLHLQRKAEQGLTAAQALPACC